MSSPGRRRGGRFSVPPSIPSKSEEFQTNRQRNSPSRQTDTEARSPAGRQLGTYLFETSNEEVVTSPSRQEQGMEYRSPPKWYPRTDVMGRPIGRGRSPSRRYAGNAQERVIAYEGRSPRDLRPQDSIRNEKTKGHLPPRQRQPQRMDARGLREDVGNFAARQNARVGDVKTFVTSSFEDCKLGVQHEVSEPKRSPYNRYSDVGEPVTALDKEEVSQYAISSSAGAQAQEQAASSNPAKSTTNVQTFSRSLAKQNEASGHSSHVEEMSSLGPWDTFTDNWDRLGKAFADWNNKRTLKHVAASVHVLRTYHDGFLAGTVPVSMQARTRLRAGVVGMIWHVMEFFLAILSGSLYIYSTYVPEARRNWCSHIQNCISIAFLCDYALRIYTEPVRFYYISSFWGLSDLLSVIPVILVFKTVTFGGDIIRLLQFVRILRIIDLIAKLGLIGTSVTQQILLLTFATFGAIILDAGILQWLEYFSAPREYRESCPVEGCLTFWQAMYFLVVTISTVGYGDITPKTTLGQAITCLTIICALIALPLRIQQIHSLAAKRPYGGSFSANKIIGSRFLILTGSVTFPGVQGFLAEFFKPTHRHELEIYPLRVIILGLFVPSFDFKQLLSRYNGSAEFIEGSPILQDDLERVSAHKAMAIFLLTDQDAEDQKAEDSTQIVRALAIHRFCCSNCIKGGHTRIILEVLDPQTQKSAIWDELHAEYVEVICPARIHYKMMARSCFVKGLYTLITNLFTSELRLKYVNNKHFLTEYFHSFDNEVYPVIFPKAFHNLTFEEVAKLIFINFSSTLFAVDTEVRNNSSGQRSRKVLLHPKGHIIQPDDVGMVITYNLNIAFAISLHNQKGDEDNGFLWILQNYIKKGSLMRRTNTEGTQLLDPATHKWRRSSLGFSQRKPSMLPTEPFGIQGPHVFPSRFDSEYRLESQLRSAIQSVYSHKEYPHWRDHIASTSTLGNKEIEVGSKWSRESESGHDYCFPKGMSLEEAAEQLLAWPPILKNERPHDVVLERRGKLILKNLQERQISMVAFDKPHILICCQAGWPTNLFYFLVEHRKPKFPNPPVVILYPFDPTTNQWGSVGIFDNVFHVKGSPLYELDLMRGGVLQAAKVVILADQGLPIDLGGVGLQDELRYAKRPPAAYTSDVENLVVAANVQRLYGNNAAELVIVEMQHAEGFHYLRPQYKISLHHFMKKDFMRNKDPLIHFGPPYMEGRAISSTMLGFLMRSTFYNKNTLSIVEQLVQGGFVATNEGLIYDCSRVLDQIPVPIGYANKAYSFLFLSLLQDKSMLAIGLYRARGTLGAPTSYVLTNPPKDCIVNPDDLVFVIA